MNGHVANGTLSRCSPMCAAGESTKSELGLITLGTVVIALTEEGRDRPTRDQGLAGLGR